MIAKEGIGHYLSRRLLPLSMGIGLILTLLAPVSYWILEHRSVRRVTNLYAEDLVAKFRQFALESPALWKYQTYKFLSLAEGFHPTIDLIGFRILDEKGAPITGYEHKGAWKRPGEDLDFSEDLFSTMGSAPILFNNRRIGTIEVLVSDIRILQMTAAIFFVSLLVGITLAVLSFLFPVRVVSKAEKEILKLNEELELKVEERARQLKEAHEELVGKEKLAMLGLIAGGMGNELRNPLGVMNNAVFFLKSVMSEADETAREYLDIIKEEIDNAEGIISGLLDFYRIKPPQTRELLVRELIDQSLKRCAIPDNIQVRVEAPEELPAIRTDAMQMGQVLRNLITNAIQAMPEGGALRIGARLNSALETDFVEISLTDTGVGISPANREKLFQPLFTTKSRGIGLGLALSKKLTEANGGTVSVDSKIGKGATFTITLPAKGA